MSKQSVIDATEQLVTVVQVTRVTTCIDNLERSGNLTAIRDLTKSQGNVLKGKKSCREKWPKTVYCKLHICIHTDI